MRGSRVAARLGHDVEAALRAFASVHAPKYEAPPRAEVEHLAELLRHLAGITPVSTIAERAGRTRSATSRWLSGNVEPRLPDFLGLLEATCRGAMTFVSAFVPPLSMPSVAERWRREQAFGSLVREVPAVLMVPVALALGAYGELPAHSSAWLAAQTGLTQSEIELAIERLAALGAIRWAGARWETDPDFEVDTRRVPEVADEARRYFARLSAERLGRSPGERYSYVCLTASDEELERLLRAQAELMALARSVAVSEHTDRLVVISTHVLPLGLGASAAAEAQD